MAAYKIILPLLAMVIASTMAQDLVQGTNIGIPFPVQNVPVPDHCVKCAKGYTMGRDNFCYKLGKNKGYALVTKNGCKTSKEEFVVDYEGLKVGAELFNKQGFWVKGPKANNGRFFPPIFTRPGSDITVRSRGDKRCLAFSKGDGDRPTRFIAGDCNSKCYVLCRKPKEIRRQQTFYFDGVTYRLESFFNEPAMNYFDAKRYCERLGGDLPFLRTIKAVKAAKFAYCKDGYPMFWVNADCVWHEGRPSHVHWVALDDSSIPVINRVINPKLAQTWKDRYIVEGNGKQRADLEPVNAMSTFPVMCSFVVPLP